MAVVSEKEERAEQQTVVRVGQSGCAMLAGPVGIAIVAGMRWTSD